MTQTDTQTMVSTLYLVRVGVVSQIGRFSLAEPMELSRGARVLCRTARGVESGTILGNCSVAAEADGRVLRKMGPEDEMLWGHLQQLGQDAFEACHEWLEEQQIEATLLEVEPLMDGKTLYFHFLNDVQPLVQEKLDQLVRVYEENARDSKFAKLLEEGCGPGCGTATAKNGCGSKGGCAVCKIASACKSPTQ